MKDYLISLFITLVIECGLFLIIAKKERKKFYIVIVFNVLSHAMLHFALNFFADYLSYYYWLIGGEIFVVFYEALCYRLTKLFSFKKALLISLLLNSASYFIGLLIHLILG